MGFFQRLFGVDEIKTREEKTLKNGNLVNAMISEAKNQGWLSNDGLCFIPEIMHLYNDASARYFIRINEIKAADIFRVTALIPVFRHLFVKGVEGVILWGISPTGNISIHFKTNFDDNLELDVPNHLRNIVMETENIGHSLHYAVVRRALDYFAENQYLNTTEEIKHVIDWIPRLGISYALFQNYQKLR